MTTPPAVVDPWISPRPKLAALWTATMFVFAYADLSSLYRADVRADLDAGELAGFTIDGGFLLAVTLYVTIPSLMVALSLLLPERALRPVGMALAVLYVLTIAVSAVGEWGYIVAGSIVEVVVLAGVVHVSHTWPQAESPAPLAAAPVSVPAGEVQR